VLINTFSGAIETITTPALVISLFEDTELSGLAAAVNRVLDGQIQALIDTQDFNAKLKEVAVLYTYRDNFAKRVILVGLGKKDRFTLDVTRQAAAAALLQARDLGIKELSTVIHGEKTGLFDPMRGAEAVVEGTLLGAYRFHELKTKLDNIRDNPEILTLVVEDVQNTNQINSGAANGKIIAESTILARDLVNRPANIANPRHMADTARQLTELTNLKCTILEKSELEDMGMHTFLSVNQGGAEPAKLIILDHIPEKEDVPVIVLAGKGITFDTGGISLKPSLNMEKMKGDLGGAAAVMGVMNAISQLHLPVHVIGLAPVTENMPDALATKPGDVVTSLKGLSVEIINTDAEGRLILADTLTYAGTFHPDAIIDIATLTGGRIVALGDEAAAVMGDEVLINKLQAAGENVGERVWPLPLYEEYSEKLKSDVADIRNIGRGREASTIMGGMFLKNFIPEAALWAHIDIAGLGIIDADRSYTPKGGTGFGVRLLVELLRHWE
jgi:leucyl aminopeptidase